MTIQLQAPSELVEARYRPWRQLAFVLGEAALTLLSGGVLFIIISRISGPQLLGSYALALAWLMVFQGVSSFGIPEFLMREVGSYGRGADKHVAHAMALGLGSGSIALGLMLVTVRLMGYPPYLVQVFTIASLALIPAFITSACRSVFLALRQMHFAFCALFVEVTIAMVGSLYLLLSGYGAIALMVVLVVSKVGSASTAATLLYSRVFQIRLQLHADMLRRTARTVLTFGIGNILSLLMLRINVIMVSLWANIETVGHFAAATKIMELSLMGPWLFSQLLLSRVAHSFTAKGDRDPNRFGSWYEALFALAVPLGVGVWVFAGLILGTLFGRPFLDALWILRILMIYFLIELADTIMSVILKAAHRQRDDALCLGSNLLTNIALNLVLLPALGPFGAAIGRVGGGVASATPRYILIARQLTSMNFLRIALKPALISIAVGSVCYLLLDVEDPVWLLLFYLGTTLILLRMSSCFSIAAIKEMMNFQSIPEP